MHTELEDYYCRSCKKLFKSPVVNPYYDLNPWITNQWQLIKDLVDKHNDIPVKHHDMIVPNPIVNCPSCYSKHTVNVKNVLSGKLIIKSEKLTESKDKEMLKCLGEWLVFYSEINSYVIQNIKLKYALYTNDRVKRTIKRLLDMRTKSLNTINNK